MICPKCGKELADNVLFCNKCGFKVVNNGPADGPTDTLRKNMPKPAQGGTSGPLHGNTSGLSYGQSAGPEDPKKSLMVPIIISSFVLLALIISIIVIVVKKKDNNAGAEQKAKATTEAAATTEAKEESSKDKTEAKTEKAKENDIETLATDVKLYEIKDGMFLFEGSLFGKSYDEVKTYVESLGYKYTWEQETKWEYGSEDNLTANRIDINKKHILGLYFQDHKLVAATFENVGVGAISKDIINNAKLAYGEVTMLSHEDKNKPFEIFCRYEKKNPNVGSSKGGSYSAFLNPYNDENHLDQQYLSDFFEGSYINPNFTNVKTK